jgi:hypothetical protein
MRAIAKRLWVAAVLLAIPLFISGCICGPGWWWGDHRHPRMATFHVYVYDYYTCAPVSWAVVEVYEEDWWDWDYVGAWSVNPAGYATAHGGYLYHDGCGGSEEKDYRILVEASGYQTEWIQIELDYWRPSETLYFYLVPWYGRQGESTAGDVEGKPWDLPPDGGPPDRVMVGEPREGPPDSGD